jgi:magnesium transporter
MMKKRGDLHLAVFNKEEVLDLLTSRNFSALREAAQEFTAPDIADFLKELTLSWAMILYRALPRKLAADVFAEFDKEFRDRFLRELTGEETRSLLTDLRPDDRTELLEELPGQVTQRLLNLLSPEDLKEARTLLGYPEDSIGRLMTPDYVAIRPEWTVSKTLEHIRKRGQDRETINYIYVVDTNWHLIGVVSLEEIVFAKDSTVISEIMGRQVISLSAFEDREEAARQIERTGLFVLPVVDSDGILVGIVTGDDVFEVAREEATEDFHKSAAVTPLNVSFKDASIGLLFKKRIGWLIILVFMDILSALVMSRFESVISAVVPLVFFMPLIIGSSGNAGSQTSTLVVREIALGDITASDWPSLMRKDIITSLGLGLTLGAAVLGPGILQGGMRVGIVVALSIIINVLVGSLIGLGTPFIMQRLGADPASSSSPLITSLVDVLGVLIYFSIATWYLGL